MRYQLQLVAVHLYCVDLRLHVWLYVYFWLRLVLPRLFVCSWLLVALHTHTPFGYILYPVVGYRWLVTHVHVWFVAFAFGSFRFSCGCCVAFTLLRWLRARSFAQVHPLRSCLAPRLTLPCPAFCLAFCLTPDPVAQFSWLRSPVAFPQLPPRPSSVTLPCRCPSCLAALPPSCGYPVPSSQLPYLVAPLVDLQLRITPVQFGPVAPVTPVTQLPCAARSPFSSVTFTFVSCLAPLRTPVAGSSSQLICYALPGFRFSVCAHFVPGADFTVARLPHVALPQFLALRVARCVVAHVPVAVPSSVALPLLLPCSCRIAQFLPCPGLRARVARLADFAPRWQLAPFTPRYLTCPATPPLHVHVPGFVRCARAFAGVCPARYPVPQLRLDPRVCRACPFSLLTQFAPFYPSSPSCLALPLPRGYAHVTQFYYPTPRSVRYALTQLPCSSVTTRFTFAPLPVRLPR